MTLILGFLLVFTVGVEDNTSVENVCVIKGVVPKYSLTCLNSERFACVNAREVLQSQLCVNRCAVMLILVRMYELLSYF